MQFSTSLELSCVQQEYVTGGAVKYCWVTTWSMDSCMTTSNTSGETSTYFTLLKKKRMILMTAMISFMMIVRKLGKRLGIKSGHQIVKWVMLTMLMTIKNS